LTAEPLELVGMLGGCGAAAAALILDDRRLRLIACGLALLIAPVIVLGDVWHEPRIVDFRTSPAELASALVVAAVGVGLLTAVFVRYVSALPILALAVLPLRVPVEIGGETANLLVPLYLVIAAGVLAAAVREWRGAGGLEAVADGGGHGRAAVADDGRHGCAADTGWPRWLRLALAATLVLYAAQAAYSDDVANAIENSGFFLIPFAVLLTLLVGVRWTPRLLGRVLIAVGAVASLCAALAIYQWLARDLFLNPELFDANELHVYFRANSLFFDPNIMGRYLALVITALAACVAWGRSRRAVAPALAACVLALVGLVFSYSITSFAALIAGLATIAVLRWGARGVAATAALGGAALIALLIAGGTPTSDIESDRSIDSGHASLLRGGIELAGNRPLAGYGSGAFGAAFYDNIEQARTTASHSEPITVAAEQGAIGLVVYVALVLTALVTLLGRRAGASLPRTAVAGCFVALLIHSLGYTGFAIDPATWALLALGIALRRDPPAAAACPDPPGASATIPAQT
jgi:putative inorganic carbon (hco3(-)) transporter